MSGVEVCAVALLRSSVPGACIPLNAPRQVIKKYYALLGRQYSHIRTYLLLLFSLKINCLKITHETPLIVRIT